MKRFIARIFGSRAALLGITILLSMGLLLPDFAFAQTGANTPPSGGLLGAIADQVPCFRNGNCRSLDSILQVLAVIAQWLLGLAGSVMVLMFVWGGAEWVFSRGESGMVKSGKDKMTNAVIGIVLMFSALAIVRSLQFGLLGDTVPGGGTRCIVDSDCSGNQQCLAGVCMARPASAGGSTTDQSCSFRDDCTENGTKPWRDCGIDNKCTDYCAKYSGSCKSSCSDTELPRGTGPFVCQEATQTCCVPK